MKVFSKTGGHAVSIPEGLATGAAVSAAVTLLGSALTAKLIAAEALSQGDVGYGAMAVLLSATVTGAAAAQARVRRRRPAVCLMSAGVYFALLAAAALLFFGGRLTGFWATAAVVFSGGAAAALMCAGKGRGGRKRHSGIPKLRV